MSNVKSSRPDRVVWNAFFFVMATCAILLLIFGFDHSPPQTTLILDGEGFRLYHVRYAGRDHVVALPAKEKKKDE